MIGQKNPSPYQGKTVAQMLAVRNIKHPDSHGINYDVVPTNPQASQRNWNIQAWWARHNFMGNDVTRVELPHDVPQSQPMRNAEWFRQSAMPWGSHFMVTETDKQRQNNFAMQQQNSQKQLTDPSTYGQFYAFMHALSAAFGTVRSG
jgi:hypothetical protein